VARDYLEGVRGVFSLLRDSPAAGAAEEDLGEGIRGFTYRSHRIYYRLDVDGVLIVRILHHARDVLRALDEHH
jgi:toxin ParE1/3/4